MTPDEDPTVKRPWTRRPVANTRPNRAFGGLYRTADREVRGETIAGVPLRTAEDTVVAAVRMGYRVVDEQIERSRRVASRLRGAVERGGNNGAADAADAVEQLVGRALRNSLQFIEDAATDPQNPLRRLATAEFNLVGSLLGLTSQSRERPAQASKGQPEAAPAKASSDNKDRTETPPRMRDSIQIRHEQASEPRAVRIVDCDVRVRPGYTGVIKFYHLTHHNGDPITARLQSLDKSLVLHITVIRDHRSGRWRGAVLDDDRVQLGFIEVEL